VYGFDITENFIGNLKIVLLPLNMEKLNNGDDDE